MRSAESYAAVCADLCYQHVDIAVIVETHHRESDETDIRRRLATPCVSSGGVAVQVQTEKQFRVQMMERCKSDCMLWVRVSLTTADRDDLYIGALYLPPRNSKYGDKEVVDDALEEFQARAMMYQQKGMVLLLGDMNARIGSESALIDLNNGDTVCYERRSIDKTVDARGTQLLASLRACGMVPLNGLQYGVGIGTIAEFTYESGVTSRDLPVVTTLAQAAAAIATAVNKAGNRRCGRSDNGLE